MVAEIDVWSYTLNLFLCLGRFRQNSSPGSKMLWAKPHKVPFSGVAYKLAGLVTQ